MKSALIASLILFSCFGHADAGRKFTKVDYATMKTEVLFQFNFNAAGKKDFKNLGLAVNDCDKAILASIAFTAFRQAEEHGVDYPEIIDIGKTTNASPMTGIEIVNVRSGDLTYSVRYYPSTIPCAADQATF